MSLPKTVVVLGASSDTERYSNKAARLLIERGYIVIPVNPSAQEICGIRAVASLGAVSEPVDTLCIYVNPERLKCVIPDILKLKPRRVIFNPGTESAELRSQLDASGIETEEACTIVLLKMEAF